MSLSSFVCKGFIRIKQIEIGLSSVVVCDPVLSQF